MSSSESETDTIWDGNIWLIALLISSCSLRFESFDKSAFYEKYHWNSNWFENKEKNENTSDFNWLLSSKTKWKQLKEKRNKLIWNLSILFHVWFEQILIYVCRHIHPWGRRKTEEERKRIRKNVCAMRTNIILSRFASFFFFFYYRFGVFLFSFFIFFSIDKKTSKMEETKRKQNE